MKPSVPEDVREYPPDSEIVKGPTRCGKGLSHARSPDSRAEPRNGPAAHSDSD